MTVVSHFVFSTFFFGVLYFLKLMIPGEIMHYYLHKIVSKLCVAENSQYSM